MVKKRLGPESNNSIDSCTQSSLKLAYKGVSMALPIKARFQKQASDVSTSDSTTMSEEEGEETCDGFSSEEVKLMQKFELKGYKILEKDAK